MSEQPRIRRIKLTDLIPDAHNANRHTERGYMQLSESVRRNGAGRSLLVDKDGKIIAGNLTHEVMLDEGLEEVYLIETDGTIPVGVQRSDVTLDSAKGRELALADNVVQEHSLDWDVEALDWAQAQGADLGAWWTAEELAEWGLGDAPEPAEDAGAQVDRAAELQAKWGVQAGDLWEIPSKATPGRAHRLLCGDSTKAEDVARVKRDAVVVNLIFDPPWNAGYGIPPGNWRSVLAFCDGRRAADIVELFGKPTWVFVWDCVTSWYAPNRPLQRSKLCFWYGNIDEFDLDGAHYGDGGEPHRVQNTRGEYDFVPDPRGKHLSDVYQEAITRLHGEGASHEKPLDWIRLLIGDCMRGDIYDPFSGLSTTLLAGEQLARVSYGIEIDPATTAVALERIADFGLEPRRV